MIEPSPSTGRPARAAGLLLAALASTAILVGCGDAGGDAGGDAEDSGEDAASATESASGGTATDDAALFARGQRIYDALCLACHQADGGGVPMMQPALDGSAMVVGDPARVVDVILRGVGGGGVSLEASGEWPQAMGGYRQLPDADVAAVATYVRQAWSNDASAVTPELVAERRAAIPGG